MRNNKQITAEISKANSTGIYGTNEIETALGVQLLEEATNSKGILDEWMLIKSAFNVGYFRGMKHTDKTTFKERILKPFEPKELPHQTKANIEEPNEAQLQYMDMALKIFKLTSEQRNELADTINKMLEEQG